ncbi:MAG: hypothetical protein QXW79_01700 [Thermoplasmata archaeon]
MNYASINFQKTSTFLDKAFTTYKMVNYVIVSGTMKNVWSKMEKYESKHKQAYFINFGFKNKTYVNILQTVLGK